MNDIFGFKISTNEFSSRIINIKIKEEIIDKLIFPFKKFDLTAIEYKPFTRFTIAKSLDDLSQNQLSVLINKIIRDRDLGCFIISPQKHNSNIDDIIFDNTIIDKASLEIIAGSVIDFKKEMIGESFVITNPKAAASCGCGLSFSI